LEEAQAWIARFFCDHKLLVNDARSEFDVRHHHCALGSLSLNYLQYGSDISVETYLSGFFLLEVPIRGRSFVRAGGESAEGTVERGCLISPERPMNVSWSRDCGKLMVRIDQTALEGLLARLVDRSLTQRLHFDISVPFDDKGGRTLRSMIGHMFSAIDEPSTLYTMAPVARRIAEAFMTMLLMGQRNNYSETLHQPVRPPAPRYVRRAEEIMRERAKESPTLQEIAEATGVGMRSLQTGFKRFRGNTPMAYLRDHRLDQVRKWLLDPTPNQRIRDIALQWGFTDLSRFAADYRRRFGELPSETLRAPPRGKR
jgi:AraC-like DNA-binding protein